MPSSEIVNEGLGLAEAAGLTENAHEAGFNFFASFWLYFQNDLISSIPITICSAAVLAVVLERYFFYNRNHRDISRFIHNLQKQLEKGNLEAAQMLASQLNSVTGEVAEEGVRLLAVQKEDFSKAYDITVASVIRKLQKYLPILAIVVVIAPFLGLFGKVSAAEADINFAPYLHSLQRKIKLFWNPPRGSESNRIVVTFTVLQDGRLSNLKIIDPGPNPETNNAALKAVTDASPFEPLPPGAGPDIDIEFTFDYNVFQNQRF